MKTIIYTITISFLLISFAFGNKLPHVKDGDIIFQNIPSSQSKAIELATHSEFTHVGIIFYKNSIPYVLEAVGPVQYTELGKWIDYGKDDYYVIKRLKSADSILTKMNIQTMIIESEKLLEINYDIFFNWSDEELYCSELVWKVFKRGVNIELCDLNMLKEYDLSHKEVKNIMKKRYGDTPPLEEPMVSPQDIFDSELLKNIE